MAEYQRKEWVNGEVITDYKLNNLEEGASEGIRLAKLAQIAAEEAKKEAQKKADKNHASPETDYGKGDGAKHGHVKLSDAVDSESGVNDGVAATPAAVKAAYDLAKSASGAAGNVPINHASTETTYGKGDGTKHGHVKLSGSVAETKGTDDGTAATPSAVKAAYDLANTANGAANEAKEAANGKAPKNHKSTTTEYGTGDANNYGHLKLSASTTSTSGTSGGIAATPSAVKAVKDSIPIKTSQLTNDSGFVTDISGKLDKSGGTMTGKLVAQNNTSYTTKQVRNVFLLAEGSSLPSGANGDLCFFYKS